jgi:hypothetical protein
LPPSKPKKDEAAGNSNAAGNDTPAPDRAKARYRIMKPDSARSDFVAEAKAALGFGTPNIKAEGIFIPVEYNGNRWRAVLTNDSIKVIDARFPFENVQRESMSPEMPNDRSAASDGLKGADHLFIPQVHILSERHSDLPRLGPRSLPKSPFIFHR